MNTGRTNTGAVARTPASGRTSSPQPVSCPPSYSGNRTSGYSGYRSEQVASFYTLERARSRFVGRSYPSYGRRRSSGYVSGLSRRSKQSFVSITTLAAPKPARKAYKKATKEMNKSTPDLQVATRHLEQALDEYPEYAAAWTLLGRVRRQGGDKQRARRALQRATEVDPKYLEPYPQLAHIATENREWAEVLRLSKAMLKINPYFVLGHYYKGSALMRTGNLTGAEKAFREALDTPDATLFPASHYMLAEVYRSQRHVTLAAREYRLYASAARYGPAVDEAVRWLTEWEELAVIETGVARKKRTKKKKK